MIYFVTTFNQKIYDISGKYLLKTFDFYVNDPNLKLIIVNENTDLSKISNKHIIYDIFENNFFNDWLKKYKKFIPEKYGGTNKEELSYWNNRFSLWARKVFALQLVKNKIHNPELIIFLDSDILIKKTINYKYLIKKFPNNIDLYYTYGKKRKASTFVSVESSFLVFTPPFVLVDEWINIFNIFYNYPRWDDGYLLEMVINKTKYLTKDIGSANNIPLRNTDMGKFFKHNKGVNATYLFDNTKFIKKVKKFIYQKSFYTKFFFVKYKKKITKNLIILAILAS